MIKSWDGQSEQNIAYNEKALKNINRQKIFNEVANERNRQDTIWGEQRHLSVLETFRQWDCFNMYGIVEEEKAKELCEEAVNKKELTWAHIAIEELSEVICAPDDVLRRQEIIQLIAVLVAWVEKIDRVNGK